MGILIARILAVLLVLIRTNASPVQVTCGSVIKLRHTSTGHLLHSHDISYGSGSGQQSVTGFPGSNDGNSYWIVRGVEGQPCLQGSSVMFGQSLRLQHSGTQKWLHSHHFTSPLTANQEISAYGSADVSDTGDVWKITTSSKSSKVWERDVDVEFRHVDTSVVLASGSNKYGRPIQGQQEICGKSKPGKDTLWRSTEGIYFPTRS